MKLEDIPKLLFQNKPEVKFIEHYLGINQLNPQSLEKSRHKAQISHIEADDCILAFNLRIQQPIAQSIIQASIHLINPFGPISWLEIQEKLFNQNLCDQNFKFESFKLLLENNTQISYKNNLVYLENNHPYIVKKTTEKYLKGNKELYSEFTIENQHIKIYEKIIHINAVEEKCIIKNKLYLVKEELYKIIQKMTSELPYERPLSAEEINKTLERKNKEPLPTELTTEIQKTKDHKNTFKNENNNERIIVKWIRSLRIPLAQKSEIENYFEDTNQKISKGALQKILKSSELLVPIKNTKLYKLFYYDHTPAEIQTLQNNTNNEKSNSISVTIKTPKYKSVIIPQFKCAPGIYQLIAPMIAEITIKENGETSGYHEILKLFNCEKITIQLDTELKECIIISN